jgi:hypothetical protein
MSIIFTLFFQRISKKLHITFRLYMTFWPTHKAMRSIAAGQNVAEKNPTKGAARLGFSKSEPPTGGVPSFAGARKQTR